MVLVSVALTIGAGPLYELAERAGQSLESSSYISAVFPDGVPGIGDGTATEGGSHG
ncbi:hypothetical protein GCM10027515_00360 [Schumannella luteola]|nr:hypothetical protein [Schumannella luteola]NYG98824.1 hypothetical protein [Schumannella luteola]